MTAEITQAPQLTNSRLLLLGVCSVILCMSFVISGFAPFPLALAIILYGRTKGYLTGLIGVVASYFIAAQLYQDHTLFVFYCSVFLFSVAIAEIVLKKLPPVRGMVIFGLGFICFAVAGFGLLVRSQGLTAHGYVLQQIEKSSDKIAEQKKLLEQSGEQDAIQVLELLNNPELIAKELIEAFPGYFFIGVFLILWFNTFLVLKSRRLLLSGEDFGYSEKDLLNFKVPFGFVLVLILGLVLAIWGKDLGVMYSEVAGYTIIKCLGVFYFFQGFGVLTDLLNFMGIVGFFRAAIIIAVVFMANYMVAAAGLLDNWFEFRKYFVKRKTKD